MKDRVLNALNAHTKPVDPITLAVDTNMLTADVVSTLSDLAADGQAISPEPGMWLGVRPNAPKPKAPKAASVIPKAKSLKPKAKSQKPKAKGK